MQSQIYPGPNRTVRTRPSKLEVEQKLSVKWKFWTTRKFQLQHPQHDKDVPCTTFFSYFFLVYVYLESLRYFGICNFNIPVINILQYLCLEMLGSRTFRLWSSLLKVLNVPFVAFQHPKPDCPTEGWSPDSTEIYIYILKYDQWCMGTASLFKMFPNLQ